MLVFVSHAFSGSLLKNQNCVRQIARCLAMNGSIPIAPQIYLPQFVDESTQRDVAMNLCLELLSVCDEIRVYGNVSEGMRLEIAEAERLGIPIVYKKVT